MHDPTPTYAVTGGCVWRGKELIAGMCGKFANLVAAALNEYEKEDCDASSSID